MTLKKKIIIIVLSIIIAFTVFIGYIANYSSRIYQNVYISGINVSGKTHDEAVLALLDGGYEKNADNVSATIIFPTGYKFTVSGIEAGMSLSSEKAANAALNHDRGDSVIGNMFSYVKALFVEANLENVGIVPLEWDYLRELATLQAGLFNDGLVASSYTIDSDKIIIELGDGFLAAEPDLVYDLLISTLFRALAQGSHLSEEFFPEAKLSNDINLDLLHSAVYVEPVSSIYNIEDKETTNSSPGVTFDMQSAEVSLKNTSFNSLLIIPLLDLPPRVSQEDLDILLFRDVIAECTTRIPGNENRLNNVIVSARAVNGYIMNSGDVFSYNGVVGERTQDNGYLIAGAIVGDRFVDSIGGGICQTSSSLYVCTLLSDLEVIERINHGLTIPYLPNGQDATINWGMIDYRFRNNTDYPIKIETIVNGRNLTVRLLGTKTDDSYIVIRNEEISVTEPITVEREDESVSRGRTVVFTEGQAGYVVDTYQDFYDSNDNLIHSRYVDRSTYRVQNRIILIPPAQ